MKRKGRAGQSPGEAGSPEDVDERGLGYVDQALADSFPASDPPPWTLGKKRD